MRHKMYYKDFADALYVDDVKAKELFIQQIEHGWSCWRESKGLKMQYRGREYCYISQDNKGHAFYQDEAGNHIMVDDQKIIEILMEPSQ